MAGLGRAWQGLGWGKWWPVDIIPPALVGRAFKELAKEFSMDCRTFLNSVEKEVKCVKIFRDAVQVLI